MRTAIVASLTSLMLATAAQAQGSERIQTDWGTFLFERDRGSTSGTVAGTPDSVFKAVRSIFAELGVQLKDDPTTRELGAIRQRAVRRMGKQPISTYLSCGEGLTGPNADTWHVFYNIGVTIESAPTAKSLMGMSFTAEAVDVPNGRNDRVVCATTGRLELEIVKRLRNAFPGTT